MKLFLTLKGISLFTIGLLLFLWNDAPGEALTRDEPLRFEHPIPYDGQLYGGMLRDSDGFLWIGSARHVLRYDGYELKEFTSFSTAGIYVILEDRSGVLWFGGRNGGLTRYDKDTETVTTFVHDAQDPDSLSGNAVTTMVEDRQGHLWIGTQADGINVFRPGEPAVFEHYRHDPENSNSLSHDHITAMLEDTDGMLWIGTKLGGLNRFDPGTHTWTHYRHRAEEPQSLSDDHVLSLLEDSDDTLWVGTQSGGLNRFERETETFYHYRHDPQNPQSLGNDQVYSLTEDASGALWIGRWMTPAGLDRFDKTTETFTHYRHIPDEPGSVSSDSIIRVYEDDAGTLWVANITGEVDMHNPLLQQFTHYRHQPDNPESLRHDVVVTLYEDQADIIWVSAPLAGLHKFDRTTETFTLYPHDPDDPSTLRGVYCPALFEDSSGTFWVGSWGGALSIFDRESGRAIKHYMPDPHDPESITNSQSVWRILEDREAPNILWLGTRGGGLDRFDKQTERFTHYAYDPQNPHSLSHNEVWTIYDIGQGFLWLGTTEGLNKFEKRTGKCMRYIYQPGNPEQLNANRVIHIHADRTDDTILWLATDGGGLLRFNTATETFEKQYTTQHGLPHDNVMVILAADRHLWLGTSGGIARFIPDTEEIRVYAGNSGAAMTVTLGAGLQTRNGEMLFGTTQGLYRFHPQDIRENQHVPPVVITSLKQGGEPMFLEHAPERMKTLTLDWRQNFFEFEFAALNFIQPEKNQYAYMLEGHDKDWYYANTRRFGRYSNLSPDQYTLRIRGSNNDGIWNEEGVSLTVLVIPPFWQTWWFTTLLIAVISGSVAGGGFWRIKAGEAQRHQLEMLVKERTQELEQTKELAEEAQQAAEAAQQAAEAAQQAAEADRKSAEIANNAKSAFLANMSHELRTPLNAVLGFSHILSHSPRLSAGEAEDVGIIIRSATHLLTLINQLLDISKIEAGRMTVREKDFDLYHLLDDVEHMFRLLAAEKQLQFLFERAPDLPRFIRTDEVKVRQVIFNVLNNAIKFTTEGGVAVRVKRVSELNEFHEFHGLNKPETQQLTNSPTHQLTNSPTHQLTNSPTHQLTNSPTHQLLFEIEDTGPGIVSEDVERIFEAFEQTATGYDASEGTGLGLPLSRNFVRLMGGNLTVKSQVGVGSLFSFSIPVRVLQALDLYESASVQHVVGIAPGQPCYRILVVDDKHENRRLLVKLLEPLGFQVREAQHGQEAIDIWDAWEPHFIWMDMRMPVLDGYKATEHIKATTKGQATAIVALTASAFEEEKAVVLSAGCDDFLRKPFKESEIFDMLHKHLGVEFVYKEKTLSKLEPENSEREWETLRQAVASIPNDIYKELCQAINAAELQGTFRVIERIRPQNALLADALEDLLKDYRFDTLQDLLQDVH